MVIPWATRFLVKQQTPELTIFTLVLMLGAVPYLPKLLKLTWNCDTSLSPSGKYLERQTRKIPVHLIFNFFRKQSRNLLSLLPKKNLRKGNFVFTVKCSKNQPSKSFVMCPAYLSIKCHFRQRYSG